MNMTAHTALLCIFAAHIARLLIRMMLRMLLRKRPYMGPLLGPSWAELTLSYPNLPYRIRWW